MKITEIQFEPPGSEGACPRAVALVEDPELKAFVASAALYGDSVGVLHMSELSLHGLAPFGERRGFREQDGAVLRKLMEQAVAAALAHP